MDTTTAEDLELISILFEEESPKCEIEHYNPDVALWAGDTCSGNVIAKFVFCTNSALMCDSAHEGVKAALRVAGSAKCYNCDNPVKECWKVVLV